MSTVVSKIWSKQSSNKGSSTNSAEPKQEKYIRESLPDKIKKLSNIAAIACFISVIAVGFGIWGIYNAAAQAAETTAGTKNIVVAKTQVLKGQTLTADTLEVKAIPANMQVEGCLDEGSLQSIIGSSAASTLNPGAQLTADNIAGFSGAGILASSITPGMTAITLDVDTASGIAGLICVGDYVSIVKPATATTDATAATHAVSIVDEARVLALDSTTNSSDNSYASVTLELSPENALLVRQAQFSTTVSLILLSDSNEDTSINEAASIEYSTSDTETSADLTKFDTSVIQSETTIVEN